VRRWERQSFNALAFLVAATGFVYFWMKYVIEPTDPFAVVNHPWQAAMLNLHVVASPAFVLMFGIVLNSHVMRKLRASNLPNRRSGYTSLVTFAAMVLSGYLLQISANPLWLQTLVAVHVTAGAVFAVVYAAHLLISIKLARRQPSPAREVA
jgi:hypothetical protein